MKMSIMRLLRIEKTRKEFFVLVGGVNCFGVIVPSSSHIPDVDWQVHGAGYR